MTTVKTDGSNFAVAIENLLDEYSEEVAEAAGKIVDEVSEDTVKKLKNVTSGKRPWKKFPKAWTKTVVHKIGWTEATVHLKKPMHRIGHLLEFDHASRNGGRVVEGYNFIAPIADEAAKEFEEKLTEAIGEKL